MDASTGAPIAVLRGKRFAGGWLFYVGGVLLAAGLASVLLRPFDPIAFAVGLCGGGLLLGLCLGLSLQTVEILEDGISWKRYRRKRFLPFAAVRKVSMKRCASNMESYDEVSLTMADGTTLLISHLEKDSDLVRYVNTY